MDAVIQDYGIDGLAMGLLSFGHLVGLVLGLGTTLYLDGGCFLSIARNSWDGYRRFMSSALFEIGTKYVMVGLGLLWITGSGFLIHYSVFDPEKLANPKLYAKLAVVTVLTVNGYFLHYLVLGRVARMSDCGQFVKSRIGPLLLFSGAVSSASWAGAFLLGALPILNNAVAFSVFVLAWAVLALVFYFCARIAIGRSTRRDRKTAAAASQSGGTRIPEAIIMERPTPTATSADAGDGRATAIMAAAFTVNASYRHSARPTPECRSDRPRRRAMSS